MAALVTPEDSPETLVAAVEGNLWSSWSTLGLGPGGAYHRRHGALMVETPVRAHPYNMVQHIEDQGDLPGQVAAVFRHFATREAPFLWLTTPSSAPGLAPLLEAHGFVGIEPITGMAAPLAPFMEGPEPEIAGVRIAEYVPTEIDAYYSFITSRWNVPDRYVPDVHALLQLFRFGHPDARGRPFLAWQGGDAICKCLYSGAAGVAGIHGVATREPARGRGIASAVTRAALRAAYREGYRVAVLHSTPMAVPVYARMGFAPVAEFHLYGPAGDFHP